MPRRAWRVTWGGITSLVSEVSSSRARRAVHAAARDAGYRPCYLEVKARRAPEWDAWAARTRYRVVSEEFARSDPTTEAA